MAESRQGRRGSYAKGVAKREEILERALEVIAREGYRGASVKELADAVGLSQAGLLHYFDSKEELFTEIVRKRDEVDLAPLRADARRRRRPIADLRDGYVAVIRHNSDVPGLVQLYSQMSVDAADAAASRPPVLHRARREPARTCSPSVLAGTREARRDHRPHRPRDPRPDLPGRRRRPAAAMDAGARRRHGRHRRRSSSTLLAAARTRQEPR